MHARHALRLLRQPFLRRVHFLGQLSRGNSSCGPRSRQPHRQLAQDVAIARRRFRANLLKAERTLQISSKTPKLLRPAGALLRSNQVAIAKKNAYVCVLGSANAFDPYRPPAPFISWLVGRALRPGAMIVLQDAGGNRTNTIEALIPIIKSAQARGFRFARLSDLISRDRAPQRSEAPAQ